VPGVAGEHERGVAREVGRTLDLRQRLVEDPLVERLALDIQRFEAPSERAGLRGVVAQ
jgi:hypothetical protein